MNLNKILIANVVGVIVLAGAAYGIEITPDDQAALATVLGLIGCVINVVLARTK